MSLQRNVQQQIEDRKAVIRRAIGLPRSGAISFEWLAIMFESRNVPLTDGALVRFADTPDQDGSLYTGLWLTQNREFWEFSVLVSRESGELLEVESISNITNSVDVAAHLPGIQKSFGTLAIEVAAEALHG